MNKVQTGLAEIMADAASPQAAIAQSDATVPSVSDQAAQAFVQKIWAYYETHKRHFAWRDDPSPYKVYISEYMLQQTQTSRVASRFDAFIQEFGNFRTLAQSSRPQLISAWQGLGYNRRALWLHQAAQCIVEQWGGVLPSDPELLRQLPGIGAYTSCSIPAFAFNMPTVFIETNIRSVFIHEFFYGSSQPVHDKHIMPLIRQTLPQSVAREWYWALMDYGSYLKKELPNPSRRSSGHVKQSTFVGSKRQVRGEILKVLSRSVPDEGLFDSERVITEDGHNKRLSKQELSGLLAQTKGLELHWLEAALSSLEADGFICCEQGLYRLRQD